METPETTDVPAPWFAEGQVPAAERAFYVEEFRGDTIVVSLTDPGPTTVDAVSAAAAALAEGDAHLVAVVGGSAAPLVDAFQAPPVWLDGPARMLDAAWLADLWLAIADRGAVVVTVPEGDELGLAAELAGAMRARKLVVTDQGGGWGLPPRSFADLATHDAAFEDQLGERRQGAVVAAVRAALDGGALNVNLCRPDELDRELFTFDGTGTLFTSGGYLELGPLRVDDLPAVERLFAQGTTDGLLRPRTRRDVARLAVTGLGARVVGRDHLAGFVGLEVDRYVDVDGPTVGEVVGLYTVSRFSGAGAGGLLVDGLAEQAAADGLDAIFAVTVSATAGAFFERKGFVLVGHDRLPAAKWDGYDASRKSQARCYWLDLDPDPALARNVAQGTLDI